MPLVGFCLLAFLSVDLGFLLTESEQQTAFFAPFEHSDESYNVDPAEKANRVPATGTSLSWYLPGGAGVTGSAPVQINNLGLRDGQDYPKSKPPGCFRILVLGDSMTFGKGVLEEQSWPAVLEQDLQKRYPGRCVEVLNAGMTGTDFRLQYQHFARHWQEFGPDLVLVGLSHSSDRQQQEYAQVHSPWWMRLAALVPASRHSALVRRLYYRSYLAVGARLPSGLTSSAQGEIRVPTKKDCADDDPCTIDFWHEFRGQCVHTADPYCTKACSADADCEFPDGMAPCTLSQCVSGQCRYQPLAVDECATCSQTSDCEDSFCEPRECRGGRCRKSERSCRDDDHDTFDVCSEDEDRCLHLLGDGVRPCEIEDDCVSDHPCQDFECAAGKCQVTESSAACGDPLLLPLFCDSGGSASECVRPLGDRCIAGLCEEDFCQWREVTNSPECAHCNADEECGDSFCSWGVCTGAVCTLETVPFCQDRDPATEDSCSEEHKACLHRYESTPGPCASPPTDDGDASTVDVCDTDSGTTLHLPAAEGLCATSNLCFHSYQGPDGFCLGEAISCMHDNACPARCDPKLGCVYDDEQLCPCTEDSECDLGNPCARLLCVDAEAGRRQGAGGACWGTLIDECVPCSNDSDCIVDEWCIVGSCAESGFCSYQTGITCDDGNPETTGFCHGQKDVSCTFEVLSSGPGRGF